MPVEKQDTIRRAHLRARPDALFLFGDNERRTGLGGQAAECRGEPNAVGVATKRKPARTEDAYWSDEEFERCSAIIDSDLKRAFEHVQQGGVVVIPAAGIGTGLAGLPERAPRLFARLQQRLQELQAADQDQRR